MVSLLCGLGNAIQHLLDNGQSMLQRLTPLLDGIEAAPQDEQVWSELVDFETELLHFMRTILNPLTIRRLGQQQQEEGKETGGGGSDAGQ